MNCFWKELGEVVGPGSYLVQDIGYVQVKQSDIDTASKLGGNLYLTLIDVGTARSSVDEYRIGNMRPVDDDYKPAFQGFTI